MSKAHDEALTRMLRYLDATKDRPGHEAALWDNRTATAVSFRSLRLAAEAIVRAAIPPPLRPPPPQVSP